MEGELFGRRSVYARSATMPAVRRRAAARYARGAVPQVLAAAWVADRGARAAIVVRTFRRPGAGRAGPNVSAVGDSPASRPRRHGGCVCRTPAEPRPAGGPEN